MAVVSEMMKESIEQGSLIRQMFDLGIKLKQQYGEENVLDFSLGNPDLPPPPVVQEAMADLAKNLNRPASLGYMQNAGFAWALEALAEELSKEQGVGLSRFDVMLSCGAAGAMNAFFHSVLERDDEVLAFTPYFGEYKFYVRNHGGILKTVPTREDFMPDFDALEKSITPKTRALIINSPNNPTGVIYSEGVLKKLVAILESASKKNGRPVYLVSDEPYRYLAYDNCQVPSVLPLYTYAVVISSFSKKYGIAGERIGYLAVSPEIEDKELRMGACIMSNRILGFVNPPVVGQYLMKAALGSSTENALSVYAKRREIFCDILDDAGIEYQKPMGAFYIFPKAPDGDDELFIKCLQEEKILGVSGKGFGLAGYIRLCYAVEERVIEKSREGFKRAADKARSVKQDRKNV